MKKFASEVLDGFAPEAVHEVFAAYAVPLTRMPVPDAPNTVIPPLASGSSASDSIVAGFIGFTAPTVRGAVLLATTFELIARARPAGVRRQQLSVSSASDWILARDWAGELVNQILGRIKNRMRSLSIALEVSAPAALSGKALSFAKPKSERTRPFLFEAHPDRIWFWLDAQWSTEVEAVAGAAEPRKEGEVILF